MSRRRPGYGRIAQVAVFCTLLSGTVVSAQPKRTVVMLSARSGATPARAAVSAVRAHLAGSHVTFRVRWFPRLPVRLPNQLAIAQTVARETKALIVFWCDLSFSNRLFLYLASPRGGRILVRSISASSQAGGYEALALIVRDVVEAKLAGGIIGVRAPPRPRTEDRAKPRAPPVVRDTARRLRLGLEVAYALDTYSNEVQVAHGFFAGVALRLPLFWTFLVGYQISPAIRESGEHAAIAVTRHLISAGVRFMWMLRRFRLGAELMFTLDYVTTVTSPRPGVSLDVLPDRGDALFAVSPLVHADLVLLPRLRVFLDVGLQIYLRNRRYFVGGLDAPEILLDPWVVRPSVMIGLSVDIAP